MTKGTIATAGWSIPRAVADAFPAEGSALERYSARFNGVEINSTFYRGHRTSTYQRWAATTPPGFRFAVKLPRLITHEARLLDTEGLIATFRTEVEALGEKLGPLLVQLPPSLAFHAVAHRRFFESLRAIWPDPIACEPRHASWFESEPDALMCDLRISRVAADPARHPKAGEPGGWSGLVYLRLHGSPRIYSSPYEDAVLREIAAQIETCQSGQSWCVFDNTASGAAASNALTLRSFLTADQSERTPC